MYQKANAEDSTQGGQTSWSACLTRLQSIRDAFRRECGEEAPGVGGVRSYADRIHAALARDLPLDGFPSQGWALIGVGGLGRGELSFFSDLDLLLLYRRSLPKALEVFLHNLVSGLWDSGFKVGHVVSSPSGLDRLMQQDFATRTNYLETRLITGDSAFYGTWRSHMSQSRGPRRTKRFVDELVRYRDARMSRFGESSYLLEPQVKEGPGGLRDLHILRWAGIVLLGDPNLDALKSRGFLTDDERQWLEQAQDFLWRVRLQLHHLRGRQQDQLLLQDQQDVADRLGFVRTEEASGVEVFMRRYYQHSARVRRVASFLLERFQEDVTPVSRRSKKRTILPGPLLLERGHIRFSDPELIPTNPGLLMELFWQAARTGAHFHHRTGQLVRENLSAFDESWRRDPGVAERFFDILLDPETAYPTLKVMLETGFLEQYIPEFQSIRYRMQYDVYHTYTVDEHLLRAVRQMHLLFGPERGELPATEGEDNAIWDRLAGKKPLFLAALVHDVAKGQGGGHAEKGAELVRPIGMRLGLGSEECEELTFLVKEHLLLPETALKRDLSDEKPIEHCAFKVGSKERLFMLFVLTVADSKATGPQIWNTWRSALLRELFRKANALISLERWRSRDERARLDLARLRAEEALLRDSQLDRAEIHSWLQSLSDRYLLTQSPQNVRRHFYLEQFLARSGRPQLETRATSAGLWEITVTCADRPGLFVLLTGVLWANGINILSADIYTRSYGVALDILLVDQIPDPLQPERIWDTLQRDLDMVLAGENSMDAYFSRKPPRRPVGRSKVVPREDRVHIDEEASDEYSVIEVYTWERPGVLYTISQVLYSFGLSIQLAKISTPGAQVVDVFYVRDEAGRKIEDEEVHERLTRAMLRALSRMDGQGE
ncbi:MAG: [protein-PII] uridylyltransferase [Desulfohalobiaceae bacterium]|nr:[protein-PII] uridylyltransferase [Desulfohalobiaceae bacterium]